MIAALYDPAVEGLISGEIDWERGSFKVMLATPDYEPSQAHSGRVDLGRVEVERSGSYIPGGASLEGRSISREGLGTTRLLATRSVKWSDFTGEFRFGIVYQVGGDELVAFTDLGLQRVKNAVVELLFDRELGVCEFVVERAA